MTPLKQEFVDNCPIEDGFRMRYGLDTARTVTLSTALLIVVLVYIYPMRIMAQGFFAWISRGYLHVSFDLHSLEELAAMFIFLGIGFIALCLVSVIFTVTTA